MSSPHTHTACEVAAQGGQTMWCVVCSDVYVFMSSSMQQLAVFQMAECTGNWVHERGDKVHNHGYMWPVAT